MTICFGAFAAALIPCSSRSQAPAPQSTDVQALNGLWGSEVRFGVPAQGELLLERIGNAWHASIAGFQLDVLVKRNDIRFTLPDNSAEFRGTLDPASKIIHGEWIQQGGVILDAQYAAAMELRPISATTWRGTVVPLEQRISAYLFVSTRDGKTTATISEPESNFFRRRLYTVTRHGDQITLEANGRKLEGAFDEKNNTLLLRIADWLPPFAFTHRSTSDALGFYPRTPADRSDWTYRKPPDTDDGWATSSLQAEGLSAAPIAALMQRILTADPESTALRMQSLLIARHGRLVVEEYFYGFSADRPHDMRSAGKTFAPVLVGVANQHGAKLTPATPLYPLFRQYSSFANEDERKQQITLRDVMTMTAGNACDDNNDDSPGNEDRMQGDSQHRDWYKYTLDLPMLKKPGGEDAVYCSGDLNLVGGAVAAATGRWLPELFDERIARPLQFGRYYLNLMPDGQAYMGGGAHLRPRDELKLGQLYLNGGIWNGKRIVSRDWVAASTTTHSHFAPQFSLGQLHEYGYGWHIHYLKSGGKTYRVFAAEGNGGQLIVVVPELDMVVGINGGSYGEFNQWYCWELELLPQFILPAAASPAAPKTPARTSHPSSRASRPS